MLLAMTTRTGRSPAVEDALHAAERHGDAVALELGTLSREAVDALLAPSLGTTARARLFRESGGNPFYLQALASAGAATATARAATVGARRPTSGRVGAGRRDLVARAERAAARAGRRGGRRSVRADARGGSGRDGRGGSAGSSRRRAGGRPRPGRPTSHGASASGIRSCGGLCTRRRAAAGSWPHTPGQPRRSQRAARRHAERAHHVARAAQPGDTDAVALLSLAGEQTALAAPATAAGWYAAALRLLPESPEHDGRRLALLGAQASALACRPGGPSRRATSCASCSRMPTPRGSRRTRRGRGHARRAARRCGRSNPTRLGALLEAERAALGDVAPGLAAALTLVMVRERAVHGDHAAAEMLADEARALARAAGDPALEAEAAATAADAAHCRCAATTPRRWRRST